MPKEYISNPVRAYEQDGSEVTLNTFKVSVGWSKEAEHVQIATVDKDGDSFDREDGLYVDLDRQSINALIRILRKARDQAFGRDE